ncbi:hypothetical protein WICANDRAFT_104086 [Wickerhamomyces anomalus NRRL Y-366-8]|uniref:Uncharacterized protein n=1 Tax=Wickerhamomyces anomalus (strain ATCC 58044 / CBS 1984 / NCYC 433 / NRRL Y-366-8) TaxID=683960 RepID=A0A1E3P7L8_WICAA|nr:uncharacterized protein WICANDRAFT_104086 [Wickerhamomyces anomalus NRRL Y-366-8]ODQ60922.1 hypothetical protein WICANDRAFT_104086 [Wickerhamomyces anomalus NRRL Y-366-8]
MPPRGQGRRKVGKAASKSSNAKNSNSSTKAATSGKVPTKKSIKSSSPSITLQEILDNLNIQFDKDIGVLQGENTRTVPNNLPLLEVEEEDEEKKDEDVEMEDAENGKIEDDETSKQTETSQLKENETTDLTDHPMVEDEDEVANHDALIDLPKDENLAVNSKRRLSTQEQIENDPSVRNPKSEFVTSQTLPAAAHALGLFSEKSGGLEETGEEFLKKKYGVSSYPKNDLKSKLPGSIPDIDFSKNKPANQVQFATFQSFIENFYRNFTEEDIKFLKNKFIMSDSLSNDPTYDPNLTPYLIPNLGALYSTIWNEEENSGNYSPPPSRITQDSILPKKASTDLNDDALESEQVSCGPLVSRLLSAILKDDKGNTEGTAGNGGEINNNDLNDRNDDDNDSKTSTSAIPEQQGWKVSSVNADYNTLEERLKRELKYIGIFMNLNSDDNTNNKDDELDEQEPDWLNPQDDEISTELRSLQNELKQVSRRNNKRKKQLLPIIENQLAWQEYLSILDDLDKQVDNAYLKRIRVPKNKKKKTGSSVPSGGVNSSNGSLPPSVQIQMATQQAHQAAANSAIKSLLEKRLRWINKIGPLFEKSNGENMKRIPKESIFAKIDLDEEDDDDYEDGEDLVLQEQH